jgi:hypothetical protein
MWAAQGDYGRAHEHLGEGLVAARAFGDPVAIGVILNDLGHLELFSGELEAAGQDLTEALPLLSPLPDLALAVRGNLGILAGLRAQQQGDRAAAEHAFEEALRLFEQSVMPDFAERIRYVHHLLADLREPSAMRAADDISAPSSAAESAASAAALRARRRWWPWGQK